MDLLEQAKYGIEQSSENTSIVFLIVVVIFLLILGIPSILKGNLKGFIVSFLAIVLAAGGTYFIFLS